MSKFIKTPQGASKILFLALSAIIEMAVYVTVIKLEFLPGYIGLYVLCALLAVSSFLLSGGGIKEVPSPSELRDDWSPRKKQQFISFVTKGKKIASYIKVVLLPLLVILGYDLVKVIFFTEG